MRLLAAGLAGVVVIAGVNAGPLTPPVGAVVSTGKTLTDVEPRVAVNAVNTPGSVAGTLSVFTISAPGSYYLTGNVVGVAGKNGIRIAAANVTLDLNGFTVQGVSASLSGIIVDLGLTTGVSIVNGSVTGWGEYGINGQSVGAGRLCGVVATFNTLDGMRLSGGTISDCVARQNTGMGIRGSGSTAISHCDATSNGSDGIFTGSYCTVTDCLANNNGGIGISATAGTQIRNCSSGANALDGILCGVGCTVSGNTCDGNGTGASLNAGIRATGPDNLIEGNNCTRGDRGIQLDGAGCFVTHNVCSGNTINWNVAGGNVCYVINAVLSPAFAGISGGLSPAGSSDPNVNFSY